MAEDLDTTIDEGGNSRRKFIRNAGLAGGVAWAAPQIVNATPAFALVSDADCLTLDDYTRAQAVADLPGGGASSDTIVGEPSVIGGTRTLTLRTIGGQQPATLSILNGQASVNSPGQGRTVASIGYTNGPFDLSGLNRLRLKFFVEENDTDPGDDVVVTLSFSGVPQSVTVPVGASTQTFLLDSYGVDKSAITSIRLEINSNTNMVLGADTLAECFQICPGR